MTDSGVASAQAEVSINADAETVYHLITDLPSLASLAEEARTMEWRKGDKTAWIGTGVRDRDAANAEHINLTLARLKEKAETG